MISYFSADIFKNNILEDNLWSNKLAALLNKLIVAVINFEAETPTAAPALLTAPRPILSDEIGNITLRERSILAWADLETMENFSVNLRKHSR